MADLEEEIQLVQDIIDTTPKDHPDRVPLLNHLGLLFHDKYLRTKTTTDLEKRIQLAQDALNATPKDHPDRILQLNNLVAQLNDKYVRTGMMADLEKVIQLAYDVVDATSDHPDRAISLNNLGCQLHNRYTRTRAMIDLEEAIQLARDAVDATPKDHPSRVMRLNNLGIKLRDRNARIGATADLEEAIQLARDAVDTTSKDHPGRILLLNNLGIQIHSRYVRTKTIADLKEAIQLARDIIDATPEDDPGRVVFLYNLGSRLGDKYMRTEAITDLEEAIQFTRAAMDATPEDHPNRALSLNNLGDQLHTKYMRTGAVADLKEAVLYNQFALRQTNSSTITRIEAGRAAFRSCAITSDWQQACEASDIAVGLIPKLTLRSLENSDKQHMLSQVVGLACDAAAAALYAEKGPLVALSYLEQGRGVLATSLEEIRTDILDLQESYPNMAEQFVRLRDELELPAKSNTSFVDGNRKSSWQAQASRRYDAGNELDKLIVKIRKRPGFEDFLRAPTEGEIQAAASCGPIIVINVSEYRCDAILVEQHQIQSLALPLLNNKEIQEKAQEGGLESPTILAWLWDAVANPILEALGFTQPPPDGSWPHVWWIPTGPLSRFPLHAAGRHSKGSTEAVLDRVMSSYSSSIKAIIYGRRRRAVKATQSAPNQALLVAMQDTPEHRKLPFANEEVAMLHGFCRSIAFDPIEPGRRKQDIISRLPYCKIFHFAGHGHTDDFDPSQSHLLLEDWKSDRLTVATLLEMNLRKRSPFLAYLSACGTGRVKDERFVDESIHLISACQLAGFRHVIGTLWEVNDELCVNMARITYEGIRDGGMTDESVCQGLHEAVRELRERWLTAKAIHGSRLVEKVDFTVKADEMGVHSTSDQDPRDYRLPRDVFPCDDNEGVGPFRWVAYVHFGV